MSFFDANLYNAVMELISIWMKIAPKAYFPLLYHDVRANDLKSGTVIAIEREVHVV